MKPAYLRCEYLVNPIGMDVTTPRLSWINEPVDGDGRGVMQFAYQVIVSTTMEELDRGNGDLWDTGKVNSDASSQVEYAGKPLHAGQRCYWKVKVWSNKGESSSWDEVPAAWWEMGPLTLEDWHGASWIGTTAKPPKKILVRDTTRPGLQEIIASEPSPLLRKDFFASRKPTYAVLYITALGEYEARINGIKVGERYLAPEWTDYGKRVQFQAYDVTKLVKEGENAIGVMLADGWYMGLLGPGDRVRQRYYGNERRLLACLAVTTPSGTSRVVTDGSWR
nr:alpha-L-rhamnosidase N-terminal domain-containing protein [Candidatus Sigynarchaeota archaeon]